MHRGVIAMLIATCLFGLGSALISTLETPALMVSFFMNLLIGMGILALALFKGFTSYPLKLVFKIGALNALQNLTYLMALQMAPVGPVAALHLCSAIVLLTYAVLAGKRRLGLPELLIFALIIIGAYFATQGLSPKETTNPLLGYLLAAASSVFLAAMFSAIAEVKALNFFSLGAMVNLSAALLEIPILLFIKLPASHELPELGALGLLIFTPGIVLLYFALKVSTPVVVGTLGLLEAITAAVFAYFLFSQPLYLSYLIATICIISAVAIELKHGPHRARVQVE